MRCYITIWVLKEMKERVFKIVKEQLSLQNVDEKLAAFSRIVQLSDVSLVSNEKAVLCLAGHPWSFRTNATKEQLVVDRKVVSTPALVQIALYALQAQDSQCCRWHHIRVFMGHDVFCLN